MLYLALQMAFLLVISTLVGVVVGWWVNRFKQKPVVEFDDTGRDEDLYALKNRLAKNASIKYISGCCFLTICLGFGSHFWRQV